MREGRRSHSAPVPRSTGTEALNTAPTIRAVLGYARQINGPLASRRVIRDKGSRYSVAEDRSMLVSRPLP